MRNLLLTFAAAGTALAFSTPAAAQYAPPPAYGAPYGNAYGYNNHNGAGRWQRELQEVRMQMDNLARSGRLTRAESRDLRNDIRSTERSIYRSSRYGIDWREARQIDQRIDRIRYELRRYSDYDGRRGGWRRY
jgi:Spy/CpxP family protein refolding chaperone